MRKNKIILVVLFGTLFSFGLTAIVQQGECIQIFQTTLAYSEGWEYDTMSRSMSPFFESELTWSFIGDNANVGITVKTWGNLDDNESGYTLLEGVSQGTGDLEFYSYADLIFWHLDDTATGESTTLSIEIDITPFYFRIWMVLIYIGSVVLIAIITVSIVVPVRKRKKKKALQETSPSSSFTPTTSQPDSPPSDLPPPPPLDYSEGSKIFCWKCGQPNTSQTSYCIKCGSDIHNPER